MFRILLVSALLMTNSATGEDRLDTDAFLDECRYLLTKLEVKMYKSRKTEEERQEFIQNFWRSLDPNPLTDFNEYRDLYYKRLSEANRLFSRGKPGYLTDRGKIFVLMGPPDEKESHYAGRSMDEHPSEIWIYRSAQHRGLDRDTEIAFIDDTGTGDYRISSRAALEGGAARATGVALLQTDLKALRDTAAAQSNPREGSTDTTATNVADTATTPAAGGEPEAPAAIPLEIEVETEFDFFKAQLGKTLMVMTVAVARKAEEPASDYTVFAKVEPAVADPLVPADDLMYRFDPYETDKYLLYQVQLPLRAGEYKVVYGIKDVTLDQTKSMDEVVSVPELSGSELTLSSLVAATKVEEAPPPPEPEATETPESEPAAEGGEAAAVEGTEETTEPAEPEPELRAFILSNQYVIPALGHPFTTKDELFIYYQVYGAAGAAQNNAHLKIDYLIFKEQKDGSWKPIGKMPMGNQTQLVQVYALPIRDIPTGSGRYKVGVTVEDLSSGQKAKGETPFIVK